MVLVVNGSLAILEWHCQKAILKCFIQFHVINKGNLGLEICVVILAKAIWTSSLAD